MPLSDGMEGRSRGADGGAWRGLWLLGQRKGREEKVSSSIWLLLLLLLRAVCCACKAAVATRVGSLDHLSSSSGLLLLPSVLSWSTSTSESWQAERWTARCVLQSTLCGSAAVDGDGCVSFRRRCEQLCDEAVRGCDVVHTALHAEALVAAERGAGPLHADSEAVQAQKPQEVGRPSSIAASLQRSEQLLLTSTGTDTHSSSRGGRRRRGRR